MSSEILDISLPISPDMLVWPGDPRPQLEPVAILSRDGVRTSRLTLSTHTGTHLDAPSHFIEGGRTVDQLDLSVLLGPCRVIEMTMNVPYVTRQMLQTCDLGSAGRVLLKTPNSQRADQQRIMSDFIALAPSAADYLREQGVRLIGIDGPSVDPWAATDFPCHRRLLAADILILENLVLRHVPPGAYGLIAVPLNLRGADGCPVRALLLPPPAFPDGPS